MTDRFLVCGFARAACWLIFFGALAVARHESRAAEPAVAATVNGQPIQAAEVQTTLAAMLEGRPVVGESLRQLQAEVLDQMIDRRLMEELLSRQGEAAEPAEVDAAIGKLRAESAEHKTTLEAHLAQRHSNLELLTKQLTWKLGWTKYVQKNLGDDSLKAFFQAHRQDFDGTERRVSHILLRPDRAGDPAATARLLTEAGGLREQIEQGKITFEDAAKKYSAGPSRHQGGDLGFIPRRGLMVEAFSQAAFSLGKGELSRPIATQFGVHLIRVTEVKKGEKAWEEVRPELLEPAAKDLYDKLAAQQRAKATISFTGAVPHFKPGTRLLAPAEPPPK